MKILVILVYLIACCFGFLLKYLNYRNRHASIPENVKDVYDPETYQKRNAYEMENTNFSIISGVCSLLFCIAYLVFNFHSYLFNYSLSFLNNIYFQTFFMFGVIMLINLIVDTAFESYDTFKIEAKYGFNKSTPATFIGDTIKQLLIQIIINGGLLALFIFIFSKLGNAVFPIFIGVAILFVLIVQFIGIYIMKLFNKFTPMEDGSLKDKIISLTEKTNYPVKRVFVVDGSKRSTKLNAFFTGYGRNRTIGLYDTLIEKLTEEEIIGVLAHEIGHAKKKHMIKRMPFTFLTLACIFIFSYFIFNQANISEAFGFTDLNVGFSLFICLILFGPISILLNIPSSYISRKHEFEADAFEAEHAGKEHAVSALKKLAKENYANLTPHPFVVNTTYSHPTISDRIQKIEKI